jgi:signal transduction histidine kinase
VAEEDDDEDEAPLEKVIVKMPKIHWGIVIESPYHVRQHYIKRARTQTLLLVLGCLLVMTVLTVFYLIGISRNFRQLIKGAKALADGNYQRRIRLITNPATPYEIIYLTGELNRMALKISAAWQQARQLNEALQQANHQLAKLDEMKSNLIDTVSHELRTPLTSIKGYTSRLLRYDDGTLDAATRLKSLKVIKQQTERLSRLVEDLLVIPDLESHRIRVFPDRIDLCALLEGCLQFIEDRDHLKIQRSWDMAACPPETIWVLADPDRLEQVLLNLLDNAVKYRSDEAAALTVRCRPALPGQAVALDVCNPCPAIAPELLPSLFEKFKRLEDGLTRTTRGSGLGLFIARGLMQAMGGNLTLAWQNGQFVATVTLLPAENPAEMDPSEEEAPPAGLAVY